jgi:hypothetical protein
MEVRLGFAEDGPALSGRANREAALKRQNVLGGYYDYHPSDCF